MSLIKQRRGLDRVLRPIPFEPFACVGSSASAAADVIVALSAQMIYVRRSSLCDAHQMAAPRHQLQLSSTAPIDNCDRYRARQY